MGRTFVHSRYQWSTLVGPWKCRGTEARAEVEEAPKYGYGFKEAAAALPRS